jgi:aryl-alcohol dehydrogenase-like predicted oxidoreductase
VPLPDSVGALGQLRQEGKIAAIGLSNVTVTQLDEALAVAPIDTVQNRLSYSDPGDLPMALACAERDIAYLAYSPLAGASRPSSIRASAARLDLTDQDLEDLRAPKEQWTPPRGGA